MVWIISFCFWCQVADSESYYSCAPTHKHTQQDEEERKAAEEAAKEMEQEEEEEEEEDDDGVRLKMF